ncbi:hypothetical protein NHX12_029430 [Muraenolepis orangiensis]|uniref:Uncharacterized protein n=1 Tax=Muraenolepis orangiensis TaxID=630683 RepID=A0A9Q0INK2_9TELE|nr:hypothetical protein NHX12_029430 [Muraenolepis orangiensis]
MRSGGGRVDTAVSNHLLAVDTDGRKHPKLFLPQESRRNLSFTMKTRQSSTQYGRNSFYTSSQRGHDSVIRVHKQTPGEDTREERKKDEKKKVLNRTKPPPTSTAPPGRSTPFVKVTELDSFPPSARRRLDGNPVPSEAEGPLSSTAGLRGSRGVEPGSVLIAAVAAL